jgi:hypothetical protein
MRFHGHIRFALVLIVALGSTSARAQDSLRRTQYSHGWPLITIEFPVFDSTKLIRRPGTNVVMFRTAATLEFVEGVSDPAKRAFFARNRMTVLGVTSSEVFFVTIRDPGTTIAAFDAYFDRLRTRPEILRALPVYQSGIIPINQGDQPTEDAMERIRPTPATPPAR